MTEPRPAAPETDAVPARAWLMLAVGVLAAAATAAVTAGTPFLLPALHTRLGMDLGTAGVLVAMPGIGTALTLVAWGWLVDRTGERAVLTAGGALAAVALVAAVGFARTGPTTPGALVPLALSLLVAGAGAASANSASGRVVVGWFPARRRGLAMGIRQMAQPLGTAVAATGIPLLAGRHGLPAALTLPLLLSAAGAVASWLLVVDPPRPPAPVAPAGGRVPNPYRDSRFLWRVHGVSVLLVVPQALLQGYLLVWLVVGHGWQAGPAAAVVTTAQLAGAVARIGAGAWSDHAGSRTGPLRVVAVAAVAGTAALAVAEALHVPGVVAVTLGVAVTVIAVTDNGLAFTAVAEHAGPFWSGRALGTQNTAQFAAVSATTPLMGVVITHLGYWPAFALAAVLAGVAVPLVPRADEPAPPMGVPAAG